MMQPKALKSVDYSDLSKLRLHIYTVGYRSQGESVLVVLAEEDKPLVVIITDFYGSTAKSNKTLQILKNEWGGAGIDLVVWTHPHADHSGGIKVLMEDADSKHQANVFAPMSLVRPDQCPDVKTMARKGYKYFCDNYSGKYLPISWNPYFPNSTYFELNPSSAMAQPIHMEFEVISPSANVAWQQAESGNPAETNDYSIAYLLHINGLTLFMGGDVSDRNIGMLTENPFSKVDFIKIPHHGSDGCKAVVLRLGSNKVKMPVAVTTVFRNKSNLPVDSVLKQYQTMGADVYCTGPYPRPTKLPNTRNGVVHAIYNVAIAALEKIETDGNAVKVK